MRSGSGVKGIIHLQMNLTQHYTTYLKILGWQVTHQSDISIPINGHVLQLNQLVLYGTLILNDLFRILSRITDKNKNMRTTCNSVGSSTMSITRVKSVCYNSPERPIKPLISGFCSMKQLGVFLLPPGWDASPSQGYPQHFCRYPVIPGWREAPWE